MSDRQPEIDQALRILKEGGVVAFPTDTVYGLGADAFNASAVVRIYDIKDRPRDKQLPLLIADAGALPGLAGPIPPIAWFLAGRFWPGGLTLVLPRAHSLPDHLAQGPTIAVRLPAHPVCLALIRGLGNPVIGTSANPSGQPSTLTAREVARQLGSKIDFVINGGRCPGGRESTVVDVSGRAPMVLREGIIPSAEIHKICREYAGLHEGQQETLGKGAADQCATRTPTRSQADRRRLSGESG
jgi:L-threonylcarbamoyladenylate synthase